ncbi:hypothetical protein glysoja_036446 [Glycine soja]|uniref:Uncharacterized protein n=1 Tax=Glycine soja TaxID=3848 RepID=A0A0B2PNL9_GLYSO|nr:hypothetical protein glysoja_036446 [Glycine soja]
MPRLSEFHTQHNNGSVVATSEPLCSDLPKRQCTTATSWPPRGRHWAVHVAALVQMGGYEEGKLERPKWVGETPLSRIVQALISFKPVFSVLKHGSRRALIRFILYSSLS